ncbi:hypothetical protein K7432_006253 [Basidiobolus ranarum]
MIALEHKVQRSDEINTLLKVKLVTCEKELKEISENTVKGLKSALATSREQLECSKQVNFDLKQKISKYQRIQRILELENKEKEPESVDFLMNYENMNRQQLIEAFFALYQVQRNGVKELKRVERFQEEECRKLRAEIEEQKKLRALKEDRIKTLETWMKNLQAKNKKLQAQESSQSEDTESRNSPENVAKVATFRRTRSNPLTKHLSSGFQPIDQLSRQSRPQIPSKELKQPTIESNASKPPLPPGNSEVMTLSSDRSSSEPELPGLRLSAPSTTTTQSQSRAAFFQFDGMGGRKRRNPFSK